MHTFSSINHTKTGPQALPKTINIRIDNTNAQNKLTFSSAVLAQ